MKNLMKSALIAFAFAAFVSSCDQAATTESTTETTTPATTEAPALESDTQTVIVDSAATPEADASATTTTEPAPAQ